MASLALPIVAMVSLVIKITIMMSEAYTRQSMD